jgi:outer membrane protein assembly factor BamB
MRVVLNLVAACLVVATPVTAFQWPDFRGPTGQGHSDEIGLPLTWSETSNVVWKQAVPGRGWSTPIVESGRLWLTTAVRSGSGGSLRALAFDVETGKNVVDVEVFRTATGDSPNPKNSLASPTPIAAGGRIFVHFGADGTAALSPDGAILWKVRLPYQSQHGSGGSPIAYDDLLIVNCDGSDVAYVVAIEQATGKIRWKTERRRPFDQAYTTPLVIRVGDVDQVVSVGAHRAAAYDPTTGAEVWRVGYPNGFSNVPRPVYGHGLVFIATGFQQPAILAVRPDGRGDVTGTHVAWTLTRGAPFTPSPILVGGELYLVSDLGVATCVDAKSGKVLWQQRLGGNYSASPVFADGRLYFQSEEGVTTVLQPGREFRRLAVNQIDGSTLGSMSVAGNSLFIRSSSHLYRIGVNR